MLLHCRIHTLYPCPTGLRSENGGYPRLPSVTPLQLASTPKIVTTVLCLLIHFVIVNLQDKGFGKVQLHKPHKNPPASVKSDLKEYHSFKLARAYAGETYFWGLLPQPGDTMVFTFTPPVRIAR